MSDEYPQRYVQLSENKYLNYQQINYTKLLKISINFFVKSFSLLIIL